MESFKSQCNLYYHYAYYSESFIFTSVSLYGFWELRTFRTINASAKWIVVCLYCLAIKASLPLLFSSTFTWENLFWKKKEKNRGENAYCRYTYLKWSLLRIFFLMLYNLMLRCVKMNYILASIFCILIVNFLLFSYQVVSSWWAVFKTQA